MLLHRCHLMYRAKQGVRLGTVIMMQMLITSFRLTGSAFHNSIVESLNMMILC